MSRPRRLPRPARIAARALLVLALAEVAWLLLANLWLNTPLAGWTVNRHPERWRVTWERAVSWYPTRVRVTGLLYEHHLRKVDLTVRADRAATTVRLLPLLSRTFELGDLRAGDATFDLRTRPPEEQRPPPRLAVSTPPGFRIVLAEVEIDRVERFAWDGVEIAGGRGAARGTYRKRIRGELEVEDFALAWRDARVAVDGDELADTLDLALTGGFAPFDTRRHRGLDSLRFLTAELELEGAVGSLAPFRALFADADWIDGLDGVGTVRADLEIAGGKLLPGSNLDVDDARVVLDVLGFRATGGGRLDLTVATEDGERRGRVDLAIDDYDLGLLRDERPFASGEDLHLTLTADELRVARGLRGLELELRIPDARVTDVTFLSRYLPPGLGLRVEGGTARLDTTIRVVGDDQEVSGAIRLHGDRLRGRFRDMDVEIDLGLDAPLSGNELNARRVRLDGAILRLSDGTFRNDDGTVATGWWMDLTLPTGGAEMGERFALDGEVELAMRDTRAVVALFAEIKRWLRHLQGILTVREVAGRAHLSMAARRLDLRHLTLRGDNLDARAELELAKGDSRGIVWFKLGPLSLAFERHGDDSDAKLLDSLRWYEAQVEERWGGAP